MQVSQQQSYVPRAEKIAQLNDKLGMTGVGGQIMLTRPLVA